MSSMSSLSSVQVFDQCAVSTRCMLQSFTEDDFLSTFLDLVIS